MRTNWQKTNKEREDQYNTKNDWDLKDISRTLYPTIEHQFFSIKKRTKKKRKRKKETVKPKKNTRQSAGGRGAGIT